MRRGEVMRRRTVKATPCRKVTISTPGGAFALALPWSIGRTFSIGHVTFEHNGNTWAPDRPIPPSWFIDLSKGGEA